MTAPRQLNGSTLSSTLSSTMSGPTQPWWRIGMMWLTLGGPVVVAVASLVSATLAVRGADVPLQLPGVTATSAHRPAVQARNHAATPIATPTR
jgi:uncharacterized protein